MLYSHSNAFSRGDVQVLGRFARLALASACAVALLACASAPLEPDAPPAAEPEVIAAAPVVPEVVTPAPVVPTVAPVTSPVLMAPAEAPVAPPAAPKPPAMAISATLAHGYYVSVGAFAVSANASRAYLKLQEAGLSAVAQTLTTRKGALTRVAAGPFRSLADAKAAAKRVEPLKLDALVVKH